MSQNKCAISFFMMGSLFISGCDSSRITYDPYAYPWNQTEDEFDQLISTVEKRALSGDPVAIRDLLWLGDLTDASRAEMVGESIAKVWETIGEEKFMNSLGAVPDSITDRLPSYFIVSRGEETGEKVKRAINRIKKK